jgi:hypothetical protein
MQHIFQKENQRNEIDSINIKQWARQVFELNAETSLMVSELACTEDFCPDVMTLIAFWDSAALRQEYRIYKAMRFVVYEDVRNAKFSMLNILTNRELREEQSKQKTKK